MATGRAILGLVTGLLHLALVLGVYGGTCVTVYFMSEVGAPCWQIGLVALWGFLLGTRLLAELGKWAKQSVLRPAGKTDAIKRRKSWPTDKAGDTEEDVSR